MKYAFLSNLIVTTNDDDMIPLNAKVIAEAVPASEDAANELLRRANAFEDLVIHVKNLIEHANYDFEECIEAAHKAKEYIKTIEPQPAQECCGAMAGCK